MKRRVGDLSEFVEHPRYGRGPRFTGVRPREKPPGYRLTTYISDDTIGGTAVEADLERQTSSPVPVLYYFLDEHVHPIVAFMLVAGDNLMAEGSERFSGRTVMLVAISNQATARTS